MKNVSDNFNAEFYALSEYVMKNTTFKKTKSIIDPNLHDLHGGSSSPPRPRRRIVCPRDS